MNVFLHAGPVMQAKSMRFSRTCAVILSLFLVCVMHSTFASRSHFTSNLRSNSQKRFGVAPKANPDCLSCARPHYEFIQPPSDGAPKFSVHTKTKVGDAVSASNAVPAEWDWRDQAHLSQMSNQHLPQWCGSCWAHSTTSMLTDRFRIHAPKALPLTRLSTQALLNCGAEFELGTCSGGSLEAGLNFVYNNYIVDETCLPSMSVDRSVNYLTTCLDHMCRDCDVYSNCTSLKNYTRFHISDWGFVSGAKAMMEEIYNRGPIACYMFSHRPQYLNYKGGIIDDDAKLSPDDITHAVEVLGYGTENGKDYWIVRNSFGTRWGENGFFRVVRGQNQLNMEYKCTWATPRY